MRSYKWQGSQKGVLDEASLKVKLNLLLSMVKRDDSKVRFCFKVTNQFNETNRFQARRHLSFPANLQPCGGFRSRF